MFKGHPKGLFVLFFSNMGERFGYYTMLAIFTLYLREYFGWDQTTASQVYGYFLFGVYFMPLLGGFLADKVLGYSKTINIGIVIMILGYAMLAFSKVSPYLVFAALAVICVGNGMFKGNLVVLVGNLYGKTAGSLKDAAFNIFYMGINIGAFFAPHAAGAIKNYLLAKEGFVYNTDIPQVAHEFLNGATKGIDKLSAFFHTTDLESLRVVSQQYIDTLGLGYNAGFAISAIAMVISILIFIGFKKYYKDADYSSKDKAAASKDVVLTKKQESDRIMALLIVFGIVIFFWMAFHQNGSTLTFFAKNYTDLSVSKFTYLLFNIPAMLSFFAIVLGLIAMINKNASGKIKGIGAVATVAGIAGLIYIWNSLGNVSTVTPELFQSFNPIFIVFMTPIVVGFFSWLNSKSKEPSSPAKIGIGMFITGIGFALMMIASFVLPSVSSLGGHTSPMLVTPYWLISTYFVLTIAELFLSPMGLSFVSKVAPPRMKGLMQGGWLGATAIGNLAAGLIGAFYENWELWQFFGFLVVMSLASAIAVALVLKKLKTAISS